MTEVDESMKGKRIELISCDDPYTELKTGDRGTIEFILRQSDHRICEDQLSVNWDNGSSLMLLIGKDRYKILGD